MKINAKGLLDTQVSREYLVRAVAMEAKAVGQEMEILSLVAGRMK